MSDSLTRYVPSGLIKYVILDTNFSLKVYNENGKDIELTFANSGLFKLLSM